MGEGKESVSAFNVFEGVRILFEGVRILIPCSNAYVVHTHISRGKGGVGNAYGWFHDPLPRFLQPIFPPRYRATFSRDDSVCSTLSHYCVGKPAYSPG